MSNTQDNLPDIINKISIKKDNIFNTQDNLFIRKNNKNELLNDIKSHSNSKFELISLFIKYNFFGAHHVICEQLKNIRLNDLIPQLVSIMIRPNFSYPIYALFLYHAAKSNLFRISLFYTLRSILSIGDENTISHCYRLCCDIFDIDQAVLRKNIRILQVNYFFAKLYRKKITKKIKLKNVNTTIFNKSIVNDNNRVCNFNTIKYRYVRINRTQSFFFNKNRIPTFEGLIFYLVKSVASVVSSNIYNGLEKMAHNLMIRKNQQSLEIKSIEIKKNSRFTFYRTIDFYDSLVQICNRLKTIPQALRQRILEAELEIVNLNIRNVLDMFNSGRKVMAIVIKECVILDSAENVPFRIIVETVDRSVCINQKTISGLQKIEMLRSHLHSVNEIYCGNDVNNIRENILDAIEKIIHKIKRKVDSKNIAKVAKLNVNEDLYLKIINNEKEKTIDKTKKTINEIKEIKDKNKYRSEKNELSLIFNFEDNGTQNKEDNKNLIKNENKKEINNEKTSKLTQVVIETNKKYSSNFFIDNLKVKQWQILVKNISQYSEFSSLTHWGLFSFIIKSGSILKQEYLAFQLLTQFKNIFDIENTGIYLRNYRIYLISDTAGLVETVVDAQSIHNIKSQYISIGAFFDNAYIDQSLAKRNFLYSFVGYSLISYLLQLKDRHNGNILIDSFGNIVHVDFGFMLGTYPGLYCMENAPFKFSHEYFNIIDINDFRILFLIGFKALQKHYRCFNNVMEIIETNGYCLPGSTAAVLSRLVLHLSDKELEIHCKNLIDKSINNIRTAIYDKFQYFSNGYF